MRNRIDIANVGLWILQGLLAALFLFAGVMKLVMPIEAMAGPVAISPGAFLRFIGVAETLGAVGLVVPWLFRIKPGLTPLAAGGLVIIDGRRDHDHRDLDGAFSSDFPLVVGIPRGRCRAGRRPAVASARRPNRFATRVGTMAA